ncbi:MAG: hypothetical protein ABJX32_05180 [Tateyamaria sp.]|uniref:transketolase family protein n=1 Tax=Tateyamaria sp. TaxID=1929288 RepID=UPI00329CF3CB
MRNAFAKAIIDLCNTPDCVFLTGDLGFMALEEIQAAFGDRFINGGVSEQNMMGVAAGLAREGMRVFAYSIAPFCYARPFEQIRNDICLPDLPVCLVGNGGGYAYGHMGPTHHALEDCAVMSAIGVDVLVPSFDEDVSAIVNSPSGPTYLRLGYDARPAETLVTAYAPWREVLPGEVGAVAALGPLAGVAWGALEYLPVSQRPAVWAVGSLDRTAIPEAFWSQSKEKPMYILEEHVEFGGLGSVIALEAVKRGHQPSVLTHKYALGYPSKTYGSQDFHRKQCGLDGETLHDIVMATL